MAVGDMSAIPCYQIVHLVRYSKRNVDQVCFGSTYKAKPVVIVRDKLQNIIDKASAASPSTPESIALISRASEVRQMQPGDPLAGSDLVASASDKADAGDWVACKTELDGIN